MQQAGDMPKQRVLVELRRVTFHRRRHHPRVEELVFVADVLSEERGGGFFGREHLAQRTVERGQGPPRSPASDRRFGGVRGGGEQDLHGFREVGGVELVVEQRGMNEILAVEQDRRSGGDAIFVWRDRL